MSALADPPAVADAAGPLPMVEAGRGRVLARRQGVGLSRAQYAELSGVSERTLATVEATGEATPAVRRRLVELDRLLAAFCDAVAPDAVGPWLFTPNAAFEDRTPAAVLAAGESDRLWQAARLLQSGEGF